jgi:uncharacterized protein YggU (UPF0235/DUF167 family)
MRSAALKRLPTGARVLRVRVRAAPSEGEANDALVRLIARALGVAPRSVALIAGYSVRLKRLKISGSAIALADTVERICLADRSPPSS